MVYIQEKKRMKTILSLIFTFLSLSTKPQCLEADIIFIIDWSGSVGSQFNFLNKTFNDFCVEQNMSLDGVKVGFVCFGADVVSKCPLTDDLEKILVAMPKFVPSSNVTNVFTSFVTAEEFFKQSSFERNKEVRKFIILISDGDIFDIDLALQIAYRLRDSGVEIFSIAVSGTSGIQNNSLINLAGGLDNYVGTEYEYLFEAIKRLGICM